MSTQRPFGTNSFFLILPSAQIFEHVEDFIFIHIMSEPVLEKSKSTLSKGTSSSPQTWAEYKERLKVFGWQNGTSYKWYCFNLNLSRKRRLKRGGLEIFYCFLSRLCLALLFLLFARKCMQSVKETHSNATIRSIRAERSRVVETER